MLFQMKRSAHLDDLAANDVDGLIDLLGYRTIDVLAIYPVTIRPDQTVESEALVLADGQLMVMPFEDIQDALFGDTAGLPDGSRSGPEYYIADYRRSCRQLATE